MATNIINGSNLAWDTKQGNLTQANVRGTQYQDIIRIQSDTPLNPGGAGNYTLIILKKMKSSACVHSLGITKSGFANLTSAWRASLTLVGIDRTNGNYMPFYLADNTTPILYAVSATPAAAGTAVTPIALATTMNKVTLLDGTRTAPAFLGNSYTNTVSAANIPKLYYAHKQDETVAMMAEKTLSNLVDTTTGNPTGVAAVNYDLCRGNNEFGLALYLSGTAGAEISVDALTAADMYITMNYKDTMLSETSYGLNYIPSIVSS
jgi:hypothetical protein